MINCFMNYAFGIIWCYVLAVLYDICAIKHNFDQKLKTFIKRIFKIGRREVFALWAIFETYYNMNKFK